MQKHLLGPADVCMSGGRSYTIHSWRLDPAAFASVQPKDACTIATGPQNMYKGYVDAATLLKCKKNFG